MTNRLLAGALLALGAPILASAQCPAGVTPDTFLTGKNFAFSVTGTRIGAIGTIMAQAGGYLMITETVVDTSIPATVPGNRVNRLAPASGRWMVNATCTGGMLQIMLNREFFSFDFTVTATGNLTLVGRDENYATALAPVQASVLAGCVGPVTAATPPSCTAPGPVAFAAPNDPGRITGTAFLNPPKACPAGLGNPLNILKGITLVGTAPSTTQASFGGAFLVFSFLNPLAYSGDITIIQPPPVVNNGPNTQNIQVAYTGGRYIIYGDCSGGELLLMGGRTNGAATGLQGTNAFTQLDFVFTDQTFSRIVTISDGGQTP